MPARPYRPSGASEPGSIPALFVLTLLAGIAGGVVEGVVGRYLISLFIVFPLLLGLVAGGAAAWRVGVGKVRAPALAALAGLLGGLAGQVANDRLEYEFFRRDAAAEVRSGHPDVDAGAILDEYLVEQTGQAGWTGFLELQAREGISIKRGGGHGLKITGIGCYILWLVELLLAGGVALAMAYDRARQPFCERCKAWYALDEPIADGARDAWKQVVAALERGDIAGALAARGTPTAKAKAALRLLQCATCEAHEPLLKVRVHTGLDGKKPQDKVVYQSLLRADQGRALLAAAKAEAERAEARG
jgi:hypothetical protein